MAPHFASHRLVKLPGVSHLLPLENPDEVAELIANHMQSDRTTQ
jgi:pimeloyl-ACP methyl ester carboxylesterase